MASEKALAIVLRVVDFSETSVIVTLFTREFGKIGAMAKGARRPKSPFDAALDVLAVCRIVFLQKSADVLDLLTEARLERRFRSAQSDLSRLYAGYYVAELLKELTDNDDPYPDLFDQANQTLLALDRFDDAGPGDVGDADVSRIVLRFELAALRILGHLPLLDACVGCGCPMETSADDSNPEAIRRRRITFGQLAGGVLCGKCRTGQRQLVSITTEAIRIMQSFADADNDAWKTTPIDARVRGELRGVMNHYLANLLGHRPRMHEFLGILAK